MSTREVEVSYQTKAMYYVLRSIPHYAPNLVSGSSEFTHVVNIISSILMTRDNVGIPGGSFVQHVVNNRLFEALQSADHINSKYMLLISSAVRFG